ncbi:HAD family hydrolase [Hydrogenimonas sp.]|uniref:HAD family hydrolase n=1 Tax=Hydrogenimonas sp. TaxID=2231112 RepID=UPI00261057E9|nr:HAD family hydrolase [Hydrogenimonas sp.]
MKTVIFDLDGTLVDTHEDITASINHVRKEIYRLDPVDSAFVIEKINLLGLNLAYEFYGVERYEKHAKELFERHYSRQCLMHAKTFPDIPELLGRLKAKACDLYVATNAPSTTSKLILQNNNIDHYFTDIIGADRVTNSKPDPEVILQIRARTVFDEIWMIGDSVKDIMAAESARVRSLFVKWGYTNELPKSLGHVPTVSKPLEMEKTIFNEFL